MNFYTCIDSEHQLAIDDEGRLLLWPSRRAARAAAAEQGGKWSIISKGSRRYHRGIATTYAPEAQPKTSVQPDTPEPEEQL